MCTDLLLLLGRLCVVDATTAISSVHESTSNPVNLSARMDTAMERSGSGQLLLDLFLSDFLYSLSVGDHTHSKGTFGPEPAPVRSQRSLAS